MWRAASRGGGGSVHGRRRPSSWLPSRRVTDLPGAPLCIPPTAVRTASRLLLWQSHYVTSGVRVVTFHAVHILISRRTISACLSRLPQHALLPTPLPQRSPRRPLPLQSFTPLVSHGLSITPDNHASLLSSGLLYRAFGTVRLAGAAPCGWLSWLQADGTARVTDNPTAQCSLLRDPRQTLFKRRILQETRSEVILKWPGDPVQADSLRKS